MIGVGLAGFGLAGRYFHAPLLQAAGMQVRAVLTSRESELRQVIPGAQATQSFEDLVGRSDVDLIVVATPNPLHFSQASAALVANKHVVVDKPMATSAAQVKQLDGLAKERGRVLSVFHNRRWDSDFLTIADLIRTQRCGEVVAFHARWDRFRTQVQNRWRERDEPGAGILYDLGSHLIDQVLMLFGTPDWLQADVFKQRPGAVVDDGFEILMGKGALRITLGASSVALAQPYRYIVNGTRGAYVKAGIDPQEDQLRGGMDPCHSSFGWESELTAGTWIDAATNSRSPLASHRGAWTQFYAGVKAAIEKNLEPPVTAMQAARVLELIEAAHVSSRDGQRVRLQ